MMGIVMANPAKPANTSRTKPRPRLQPRSLRTSDHETPRNTGHASEARLVNIAPSVTHNETTSMAPPVNTPLTIDSVRNSTIHRANVSAYMPCRTDAEPSFDRNDPPKAQVSNTMSPISPSKATTTPTAITPYNAKTRVTADRLIKSRSSPVANSRSPHQPR